MSAASRSAIRLHTALTAGLDRLRDERGAAMAEYGLLLTMVAIACIGILLMFGGEVLEMFTAAEDQVHNRPPVPPAD